MSFHITLICNFRLLFNNVLLFERLSNHFEFLSYHIVLYRVVLKTGTRVDGVTVIFDMEGTGTSALWKPG